MLQIFTDQQQPLVNLTSPSYYCIFCNHKEVLEISDALKPGGCNLKWLFGPSVSLYRFVWMNCWFTESRVTCSSSRVSRDSFVIDWYVCAFQNITIGQWNCLSTKSSSLVPKCVRRMFAGLLIVTCLMPTIIVINQSPIKIERHSHVTGCIVYNYQWLTRTPENLHLYFHIFQLASFPRNILKTAWSVYTWNVLSWKERPSDFRIYCLPNLPL